MNREIVFLLEERSAQAMLEGFIQKIIPTDITPRYIVFEGKQDMEKQMELRLRGYRVPDAQFVVLRDQDSGDCKPVKEKLLKKCDNVGKSNALVRIACRELESWYLADLAAVERGLNVSGLAHLQNKNPYRSPDSLSRPSERLARIAPSYQKVGGSRAIGPYLDLKNTRSHSFAVFIKGFQKLFN